MFRIGRLFGAALILLILLVGTAHAQTLEEFTTRLAQLIAEESAPDERLALCDTTLAEHARDPRYISTVHSYRSHAYLQKEDYAAAEEAVNKALEADPTSALAHFTNTDVLYALKRPEEARSACLKGTEIMEFDQYKSQLRDMCEQSFLYHTEEQTVQKDMPPNQG